MSFEETKLEKIGKLGKVRLGNIFFENKPIVFYPVYIGNKELLVTAFSDACRRTDLNVFCLTSGDLVSCCSIDDFRVSDIFQIEGRDDCVFIMSNDRFSIVSFDLKEACIDNFDVKMFHDGYKDKMLESVIQLVPHVDDSAVVVTRKHVSYYHFGKRTIERIGVPGGGKSFSCCAIIDGKRTRKIFVGGHHKKDRTFVKIFDNEEKKLLKEIWLFKNRRTFGQYMGSHIDEAVHRVGDQVCMVQIVGDQVFMGESLSGGEKRVNYFGGNSNLTNFLYCHTDAKTNRNVIIAACGNGIHILDSEGKTLKCIKENVLYDKKVKVVREQRKEIPVLLHVKDDLFIVRKEKKNFLMDLGTGKVKEFSNNSEKLWDKNRKTKCLKLFWADKKDGVFVSSWCGSKQKGVETSMWRISMGLAERDQKDEDEEEGEGER